MNVCWKIPVGRRKEVLNHIKFVSFAIYICVVILYHIPLIFIVCEGDSTPTIMWVFKICHSLYCLLTSCAVS